MKVETLAEFLITQRADHNQFKREDGAQEREHQLDLIRTHDGTSMRVGSWFLYVQFNDAHNSSPAALA